MMLLIKYSHYISFYHMITCYVNYVSTSLCMICTKFAAMRTLWLFSEFVGNETSVSHLPTPSRPLTPTREKTLLASS